MKNVCILFAVLIILCLVSSASIYAAECEFIKDDKVKVNDQGYIMSWLILDPYIKGNAVTALAGPVDYFEDHGGEAKLKPKEGDKVKIKADGEVHIWKRLNFLDLKDMAQIGAAVGGNELDFLCWGGQGPTNTQTYLVNYLKWKKAGSVTFTVGADDGGILFFNGKKFIDSATDKDWAAGNCGSGDVDVSGGAWNILVVKCLETGGEWGISVQVDPVPDEVDNKGPASLFAVDPMAKLAVTWGGIKK